MPEASHELPRPPARPADGMTPHPTVRSKKKAATTVNENTTTPFIKLPHGLTNGRMTIMRQPRSLSSIVVPAALLILGALLGSMLAPQVVAEFAALPPAKVAGVVAGLLVVAFYLTIFFILFWLVLTLHYRRHPRYEVIEILPTAGPLSDTSAVVTDEDAPGGHRRTPAADGTVTP